MSCSNPACAAFNSSQGPPGATNGGSSNGHTDLRKCLAQSKPYVSTTAAAATAAVKASSSPPADQHACGNGSASDAPPQAPKQALSSPVQAELPPASEAGAPVPRASSGGGRRAVSGAMFHGDGSSTFNDDESSNAQHSMNWYPAPGPMTDHQKSPPDACASNVVRSKSGTMTAPDAAGQGLHLDHSAMRKSASQRTSLDGSEVGSPGLAPPADGGPSPSPAGKRFGHSSTRGLQPGDRGSSTADVAARQSSQQAGQASWSYAALSGEPSGNMAMMCPDASLNTPTLSAAQGVLHSNSPLPWDADQFCSPQPYADACCGGGPPVARNLEAGFSACAEPYMPATPPCHAGLPGELPRAGSPAFRFGEGSAGGGILETMQLLDMLGLQQPALSATWPGPHPEDAGRGCLYSDSMQGLRQAPLPGRGSPASFANLQQGTLQEFLEASPCKQELLLSCLLGQMKPSVPDAYAGAGAASPLHLPPQRSTTKPASAPHSRPRPQQAPHPMDRRSLDSLLESLQLLQGGSPMQSGPHAGPPAASPPDRSLSASLLWSSALAMQDAANQASWPGGGRCAGDIGALLGGAQQAHPPYPPGLQAAALGQQQQQQLDGTRLESKHHSLYKTELCRSWSETGSCRYGLKCQFAHGAEELRPVQRHPKYKTEICRTFAVTGTCPYGTRCRFIHYMRPAKTSPPGMEPPEHSPAWPAAAPAFSQSPPVCGADAHAAALLFGPTTPPQLAGKSAPSPPGATPRTAPAAPCGPEPPATTPPASRPPACPHRLPIFDRILEDSAGAEPHKGAAPRSQHPSVCQMH
eukprot:jgi/Tetstr1/459900/TSEL_005242.t1